LNNNRSGAVTPDSRGLTRPATPANEPSPAVFVAAVMVALSLAACARPTGDFGRAKPSVVHDTIMPAIGTSNARGRNEPVSDFNLTNDEREFRDRAWALVSPPHTHDWIGAVKAEGQRTRILYEADRSLDPEKYYQLLREDRYQSSDARYDRVIHDINADIDLVGPFYVVMRRVIATDAERLRVVNASVDATDKERKSAYARVYENRATQDWACRALIYRLRSYRNAIDRLEIETPSDRLFETNQAWRHLAAVAKDCGNGAAGAAVAQQPAERPSRIATGWGIEQNVPQK